MPILLYNSFIFFTVNVWFVEDYFWIILDYRQESSSDGNQWIRIMIISLKSDFSLRVSIFSEHVSEGLSWILDDPSSLYVAFVLILFYSIVTYCFSICNPMSFCLLFSFPPCSIWKYFSVLCCLQTASVLTVTLSVHRTLNATQEYRNPFLSPSKLFVWFHLNCQLELNFFTVVTKKWTQQTLVHNHS